MEELLRAAPVIAQRVSMKIGKPLTIWCRRGLRVASVPCQIFYFVPMVVHTCPKVRGLRDLYQPQAWIQKKHDALCMYELMQQFLALLVFVDLAPEVWKLAGDRANILETVGFRCTFNF